MKISKLFHWLYALLMLMPVFFIGFTCCYVVFNDNAFESYYGDTINDYEYVEVTSISDFKIGNTYHFQSMSEHKTLTNTSSYYVAFTNIRNIITSYPTPIDVTNINAFYLTDYTSNYIIFKNIDTNESLYTININTNNFSFDFDLVSYNYGSNSSFTQYLDNTIYRVQYNKYSYLDDVFEYSLDKLEESSYFSWAYDSFLVSPFRYIGNLFSVPSNSVIYLFLSYWLDISIIYLVFDMVMYVPLLVHRWLDKGVLE